MQATRAKSHTIVKAPLDNILSCFTDEQRAADIACLQEHINWAPGERVAITKPLLFFLLTPSRYHSNYKTMRSLVTTGGKVSPLGVLSCACLHLYTLPGVHKGPTGLHRGWQRQMEERKRKGNWL